MDLLQMSFTGAILIFVIAVIRAITIHRLPKKTFLVLWMIALARLLIPFSVPSPFSVYSLMKENELYPPLTDTVVYEDQQPIYPVEIEQIQNSPVVSNTDQTLQTAHRISIWTTLWLIGMLILAGLFLVSYLRCRREFRTALPIHNAVITDWLDKHQLKRKIEIRQFSGISTPMTYGLIRPVILLPQNSDWENKQQLQYILFHEYVHICHYDTALKILATIATCIHWFNPMVWIMYILFNRDIELTCDECVVKEFGRENKSIYAKILIGMEERKNIFAPFCNNFSKNAIEERIESIMKTKKTSVITLVSACMIIVSTTGVFATSVSADKDNNPAAEGSAQTITQTRTSMTDKEHDQLTAASNVEWWTYEEYAEWLENEKQELSSIIGSKCWTPSKGEFVWTKEMVDETIQMYEEILEKIKNGALYVKPIYGDNDNMAMTEYSMYSISAEVVSDNTAVSEFDTNAAKQVADTNTEQFKIYEQFGMTCDNNKQELTFNGKLVRWFEDYYPIDETNKAGISYFNENGVVDVYAVRDLSKIKRNADGSFDPGGKLVGLKEFTEKEFAARDIDAIKNPKAQTAIAGDNVSKEFTEKELSDRDTDTIEEPKTQTTVAGDNVSKVFAKEEFAYSATDTIEEAKAQTAIAGDPISDDVINAWLAEYKDHGVTYNTKNDQWYFNGEKVRRFVDILTSNGEDLSSGKFHGSIRTLNGKGTVDIYTVRDFDKLNSEGNGTLIDVKAYSQEEFDEHTRSSGIMTETP